MNIQSALVRSILEHWESYEWTVQGFGFIRTKLFDVGRIHVWDSILTVPRVSTLHEHPWPLKSTIISGELINQRFVAVEDDYEWHVNYMHSNLATGEGGGLLGDAAPQRLRPLTAEVLTPGMEYAQDPRQIHRSIAQDGTVTLMARPQGPPLQKTSVYWPAGTHWISAEPRPALASEVETVIEYALMRWNAV